MAESSIPLSDNPAAYSAMPIDFRKSATVATTLSLSRLGSHHLQKNVYPFGVVPPVESASNGGALDDSVLYRLYLRSAPDHTRQGRDSRQDETSIVESAGCARVFLPASLEKLSMA